MFKIYIIFIFVTFFDKIFVSIFLHKIIIITQININIIWEFIMPVTFIFSGVFLILFIFNKIKFLTKTSKQIMCVILSLICVSYFFDSVCVSDVYFNLVLCFSCLCLIMFLLKITRVNFQTIAIIFLSSFTYFQLLSLYGLFSNYVYLFVLLSLMPILFKMSNLNKVFTILVSAFFLSLINVKFELEEFTFAFINFNLVFETCLIGILCLYIFQEIKNLIGGNVYETKNFYKNFESSVFDFLFV